MVIKYVALLFLLGRATHNKCINMKIKVIIIVLILISACQNKAPNTKHIKSIKMVVTDSTVLKNDDQMLSMAGYTSHQDDGFIIHNIGEQSLVLYDSVGAYKGKLKNIGRGEGEYLNINSFIYDNDKIIIYDAVLDKSITYSKYGNKINEIVGILEGKYYFRSRKIYKINDSYYLTVVGSKNYPNNIEQSILLKEIHGNNTIGKYADQVSDLKVNDFSPHITNSNQSIYVAYGMLGKLYKINLTNNKIVKEVNLSTNFKTPKYQLSEQEILKNKKLAREFEKDRSKISNIIYSNNIIYIYYRSIYNNITLYSLEAYDLNLELLHYSNINYIPNYIDSNNYFRSIFYDIKSRAFILRKGFIIFEK
jgi:hypothetical protein